MRGERRGMEEGGPFLAPWQKDRPTTTIDLASPRWRDGFTVGRTHVDCVVEDNTVSSRHCTFRVASDGSATILDQSTNGTLVNGTKLGRGAVATLEEGDVVSLVVVIKKVHVRVELFRHVPRPAWPSPHPHPHPEVYRRWTRASTSSAQPSPSPPTPFLGAYPLPARATR